MIIKTLILHNQGLHYYVKKMFIKQRRHHVNACVFFPERVKLFNEINNGFRSTEYEREIEDNERVLVSDGIYTTKDLLFDIPYVVIEDINNFKENIENPHELNIHEILYKLYEKFK